MFLNEEGKTVTTQTNLGNCSFLAVQCMCVFSCAGGHMLVFFNAYYKKMSVLQVQI